LTGHLSALAAQTPAVYERQAERFDRERPKTFYERGWIDRFTALLPEGGRVLDLGCGAGDPIAGALIKSGFLVTGLDISHAMLGIARSRFPDGEWLCGDMRALNLNRQFDGILGWDSFFHLTPAEQRTTLPKITAHLAPKGALLVSVGPQAGEVTGHVGGEPVYHASLSEEEYRSILLAHDATVRAFVREDPECDFRTLLLAGKTSSS